MRRSTVILLLFGCTAAALAGWLWWADDVVLLAPPGGGAAVAPGGGGDGPAPAPAPDRLRVVLRATPRERFVQPPADAVRAETATGEPLAARVVAGVGAGLDVERVGRGAALLEIEGPAGLLLRRVSVDPAQPSRVRVGAPVVVRGQVVDAQQQPIAAARVWLGERTADGLERSFAVDDDGRFEAFAPAGAGVPLVVRAPGFASQWRPITAAAGAPELREVLQPATTLHLQVAARAVEIERARAFVVPGTDGVTVGLAQWPFFAQVLGGYEVDADGKATVDDLPQRGEVGVVMRHPLAALRAPVPVTLAAEPQRVVVPLSIDLPVQMGAVVDEAGEPLAGATVFARPPRLRLDASRSRRLLPPYLDLRGVCAATAGASGEFSIGVPGEGARLSVRKPGFAGRDVPAIEARNDAISLPAWRGGDAVLQVAPPSGDAAWILAFSVGDGSVGDTFEQAYEPGASGTLSLPYAGRYDVTIRIERPGAEPVERVMRGLLVTGPVGVGVDR